MAAFAKSWRRDDHLRRLQESPMGVRSSAIRKNQRRFRWSLTREVSMRRSWLFILLIALVLEFLAGTAGATVRISGRHGMSEIAATCASVGGTFSSSLGGEYQCSNSCGDGQTCTVSCDKEGNCEGDCPSCGRRQRRGPVPMLRGAHAVENVLKNSAKRY